MNQKLYKLTEEGEFILVGGPAKDFRQPHISVINLKDGSEVVYNLSEIEK